MLQPQIGAMCVSHFNCKHAIMIPDFAQRIEKHKQQAHQCQLLCHQEVQCGENFAPVRVPSLLSTIDLVDPCLLDALVVGVEYTGVHLTVCNDIDKVTTGCLP